MELKASLENRNLIRWEISKNCNFKCNYCGAIHDKDARQVLKPIDTAKLSDSLDCLPGEWLIDITGGEPFLEKNFIEISEIITKKHYLSLNTNLSTNNVIEFADKINPEKCSYINASIHILEREKRDKDLKAFIDRMVYFQEKGFRITAVYVTYPELFSRIKADISFLKEHGINRVRNIIFRGWYQDVWYPDAFNENEKEFLKTMETESMEFEVLEKAFDYHGKICRAGQKFLVMDRNGDLRRCSTAVKSYGNFFDKTFTFDENPKPCPVFTSDCPHECIEYNLGKKANAISISKEEYFEKLAKSEIHDVQNKRFPVFSEVLIIIKKIIVKTSSLITRKFWQLIGSMEKAGIPLNKIKKIFKSK